MTSLSLPTLLGMHRMGLWMVSLRVDRHLPSVLASAENQHYLHGRAYGNAIMEITTGMS